MGDLMEYKGYLSKVEYSKKDHILFGCIQGIDDTILFEGESITQLEEAFQEAVDDYLELCARIGREPQKAYKGSFNIRISPELHKKIARIAMETGKSLNETIETSIVCYVENVNKEQELIDHRYVSILKREITIPNSFEYEAEKAS